MIILPKLVKFTIVKTIWGVMECSINVGDKGTSSNCNRLSNSAQCVIKGDCKSAAKIKPYTYYKIGPVYMISL